MNSSEILFKIDLDKENIPEKINWSATDSEKKEHQETNAISVALWDNEQKNTMRIDLWTNDMPVDEMKRFHVDCIGGLAQTILNATGDEFMAKEINALCDRLVEYLKKEHQAGK